MSLLVNAYIRDENGEMSFIDPVDPSEELAGFESYRHSLYGSRAARKIGLRLLPELAKDNIYAEGEDLARLRSEVESAISNIELFEAETGTTAERLLPRFENILRAVNRAEQAGGGVVIW